MSSEAATDKEDRRPAWQGWFNCSPLADGWSRLAEWSRWWRNELRDMLPLWLRQWGAPLLLVEANTSELRLFYPPQETPLSKLSIDGDHNITQWLGAPRYAELLLDGEVGLAVPVTLPDAAAENLRQVLGFSMDRYTPFREDEVFFDYRIKRRDRVNKRIELVLYVVPRVTLERILRRLATERIEAVTADITLREEESSHGRAGINLLPKSQRRAMRRIALLNTGLGAMALVLLMMLAMVPLYQRHLTVDVMEAALSSMRSEVRGAEQRRAEVAARSETLRTIAQRRASRPPVLDVLRELTTLTPDEAWAGQVELKGGRIKLTGEAVAGSALMEALTASDFFFDPRFEAPLTQNPKSDRERFVISVALRARGDAP